MSVYRENLTEKEAFDLEIELISKIGRSDLKLGPLTNLTDGGEGQSGAVVKESTRQKLRERMLNFKHTPKSIDKIRESNRRRVVSEETRELMGSYRKGVPLTEEKRIESVAILNRNREILGPPASKFFYRVCDPESNLVYEGLEVKKILDMINCGKGSFYKKTKELGRKEIKGFFVEKSLKADSLNVLR